MAPIRETNFAGRSVVRWTSTELDFETLGRCLRPLAFPLSLSSTSVLLILANLFKSMPERAGRPVAWVVSICTRDLQLARQARV